MDGISGTLAAASTQLFTDQAATSVQVKALKEAMDQAASSVVPLIEGLGENVDVTA